ncbi:MAG TPA: hypothetical protein VLZ05_01495 [Mycobacterium sp.]|nr:hypothetical protein [Mycobacterium sp.]HUH67651.1 hypothetical protein [Mycobacterium sp.]
MAFDRRAAGDPYAFTLTSDNTWTTPYYAPSSPDPKARRATAGTA